MVTGGRWRLILITFVMFILLAFWFALTRGLVEISVVNSTDGPVSYSLTSSDGKTTTKSSSAKKFQRLLSTGDYQVTVSQGDNHYFSIIKVGRFLNHTTITASLKPEKQRTYIGDNPGHCVVYSNALYSYDCGAAFTSISEHIPASSSTPTYTQKIPSTSAPEGLIEGIIKTSQGNLALIHQGDIEGSGGHILYLLNNSLAAVKAFPLTNLDISSDFNIASYGPGFITYSSDYKTIFEYSSFGSAAAKLSVKTPSSSGFKPTSLMTDGQHITESYTNAPDGSTKPAKNEVIDYVSGHSTSTDWTGTPLKEAVYCGQNHLCVLTAKQNLEVYTADKSKLKYTLSGIRDMASQSNQVLLATKDKTIIFDPANRTGTINYTFGTYSFCGLQPQDDLSYILCLQKDSKKVAVLISESGYNDGTDKKIQQLQTYSEVQNISVNGRFIFIVPRSAALKYRADLNITVPDPLEQSQIDQKINSKIDSLGIDRKTYGIVLTQ